MILNDLLDDVLGRVEENPPDADYFPGPTFWNLVGEVWPKMVDAMFESNLITGTVQANNQLVTIAADTTYFTLPKGAFGPLRLKAPYSIRKTSLAALDQMVPDWQQQSPGTQIRAWFPLGVSGFGVFPQMIAETSVVMDWIVSPVNEARPYTGNETIPFQTEFADLVAMYAAASLRMKEGGSEAEGAATVLNEYLGKVKVLSLFQGRLDALVLTKAYGGNVGVNRRTVV
jgi:hypothetical protein